MDAEINELRQRSVRFPIIPAPLCVAAHKRSWLIYFLCSVLVQVFTSLPATVTVIVIITHYYHQHYYSPLLLIVVVVVLVVCCFIVSLFVFVFSTLSLCSTVWPARDVEQRCRKPQTSRIWTRKHRNCSRLMLRLDRQWQMKLMNWDREE